MEPVQISNNIFEQFFLLFPSSDYLLNWSKEGTETPLQIMQ